MLLHSLQYQEYEGTPQQWTLNGLVLEKSNLIVGKNATGKSRTINVVNCLAKLLSGKLPALKTGAFDAVFINDDGKFTNYSIVFKDEKVIKETLQLDGKTLLSRTSDHSILWYDKIKDGMEVEFQPPENEVSAFARRDSIQHPFFETLFQWASSVRYYGFGTTLGKDHISIIRKGSPEVDDSDFNQVSGIFKKGKEKFKEQFLDAIIMDMGKISYPIKSVELTTPSIMIPIAEEVVWLGVQETDLPGITDQHGMSQGMFRALSVIIQLNYMLMTKKATCILIDDIGEGLDFERSCALLELLRTKCAESSLQLIMATNDRFVMNNVPLEEWLVLDRVSNNVQVITYKNSKRIFDEFKFTGLSNFDFLATNFIHSDDK